MPQPTSEAQLLEKMQRDWDERARENARYYVATGKEEWTDDEFFASGRQTVKEEILTDMINICQGKDPAAMRVLEIGCGAGRVTRALAELFGEVHAVDVSSEMISYTRTTARIFPSSRGWSSTSHSPPSSSSTFRAAT
jgi:cyclopropane fatty-acyl-phospholipid synthase-like methyltransferase